MPMVRSWRLITATAGILLAGGLAGCGGSNGPPLTIPKTTGTTPSTVPTVTNQTGGGNCSRTSVGFAPLTDLGHARYHGYEGGLYPGGSNTPPSSYLNAGLAAARKVRPLSPSGTPSASGRIVVLSIGMSNASITFHALLHAAVADPTLSPGALVRAGATASTQAASPARADEASLSLKDQHVMLVNGAVSSFDAQKIVKNEPTYFGAVETDLTDARVTPDQVQAIWLYEAVANQHQPFPADARQLEGDINTIIAALTARFPNLRLLYITSREYGGYALTTLNPEPYAYDSGFAVKWAVASRMSDPRMRPWVAWGPYTWADGTHPRSDGLTWNCADFSGDGTHPSSPGAKKLGRMLLSFFTTNPTTRTWFDPTSH
jgi:hypothetical protein